MEGELEGLEDVAVGGGRDLAIATVRYRVTQKYAGVFERDETTVRNCQTEL